MGDSSQDVMPSTHQEAHFSHAGILLVSRINGIKMSVLQAMYGYSPNFICDNARMMQNCSLWSVRAISLGQFCSEHIYDIIIITATLYRDILLNGS